MNTIGQEIGHSTPGIPKNLESDLNKTLLYIGSAKQYKELRDKFDWILPVLDVSTTVGIEVEVENIRAQFPLPKFFLPKNDPSLRNNGMEFTTVPLSPPQLYQALVLLWIMFDKVNKGESPEFSWRTSDHLHVDITQLTPEQFKNFLLLSVVCEKLLFALTSGNRHDRVFCVPIGESNLIEPLAAYVRGEHTLNKLIKVWPKYSAVNLGRMIAQNDVPGLGTVEFRHQSGTKKLENVLLWIAVIVRIYNYAKQVSTKDLHEHLKTLNSDSHYNKWLKEVLSPTLASKFKIVDYPTIFSSQISIAKRIIAKSSEPKTLLKSSLVGIVKKELKKKEEQIQKESQSRQKLKASFPPQFAFKWNLPPMHDGMIFDDLVNFNNPGE